VISGALLGEGAHPLAHVLGGKGGLAQLDQLRLDILRQVARGAQQLGDHALVAFLRQGGIRGKLRGELQAQSLQLISGCQPVHEAPAQGGRRVDVFAEQEELTRARHADRVDEAA
jgi:hypothetical protein